MSLKDDLPAFRAAKKWLGRYFAGERPAISELPLRPIGGEFRQGVWSKLCEIPYGQVVTYGDIAKKMAAGMNRKSMSSQAVGGAVGHNPISIIIPCHRGVGANGSLTGYAGGIGAKIKLLQLEGADMSRLFAPTRGTALSFASWKNGNIRIAHGITTTDGPASFPIVRSISSSCR